jgi:hypothetical protein
MPAKMSTSDRIIRVPASRVEPKVFVNPAYADPGGLGQVVQDLRSLLHEAKKVARELGQENTRGQRLAHSLSPFLRQHTELVEQHAKVLRLIDERAGEAGAIYKLLADRAEKIDLFDSTFDRRMSEMRELLGAVESRLSETRQRVAHLEEQSSQALLRLRREFDAHLIQAADDANARIESSGDRLDEMVEGARTGIAAVRDELDHTVSGARSCVREAIDETRDATDRLYADLERRRVEATTAALEAEESLDAARDTARTIVGQTQTRIDNALRLGRLKLDELCNAFTTWIEAGQTGIDQSITQSAARLDDLRGAIATETTRGITRLESARDESIRKIDAASDGAASKFEDARRALGEVTGSVRSELSSFDTAMFARVDAAKQRIEGLVEQEAERADALRAEVGSVLDQRLADLTAQCDRAQSILLGENGPDTTGLLVMLEKAEKLERAVETADERAAFATRQLESIREQANQVRTALSRAVLLAADATDQADAKAAMLSTALEQARAATDAISGAVRRETEGAD